VSDDTLEMLSQFLSGFLPFKLPKEDSAASKQSIQTVSITPIPLPVIDVTPAAPQAMSSSGKHSFDWHTGDLQKPLPTVAPPEDSDAPAWLKKLDERMASGKWNEERSTIGKSVAPQPLKDEREAMMMAWQPFEPFFANAYQPQPMQEVSAAESSGYNAPQPSFIASSEPGTEFQAPQAGGREPQDIGDKLTKLSDTMKDLIRILEETKRREVMPAQTGPQEGGFIPMGMAPASHVAPPVSPPKGMPTSAAQPISPWIAAIMRASGS
jgi:hypothetical protein